jgi:hypothetical protein
VAIRRAKIGDIPDLFLGISQRGSKPSTVIVDGPVHARAEFFLNLSEFGEPGATLRLWPDDKDPFFSFPSFHDESRNLIRRAERHSCENADLISISLVEDKYVRNRFLH